MKKVVGVSIKNEKEPECSTIHYVEMYINDTLADLATYLSEAYKFDSTQISFIHYDTNAKIDINSKIGELELPKGSFIRAIGVNSLSTTKSAPEVVFDEPEKEIEDDQVFNERLKKLTKYQKGVLNSIVEEFHEDIKYVLSIYMRENLNKRSTLAALKRNK